MVIDRVTTGGSLVKPLRSYCDHCRATLESVDLIPIISFVMLGAKCRYCKKPLSIQYPIVEGLTAVLFTVSLWVLAQNANLNFANLIFWFLLISTMVVVAVVDFKFSLIPTTFVYATSLVALFYNFFVLPSPIFVEHVIAAFGASVFFLLIVLITFGRGMGQGDIILAFLMGMVLGVESTVLAIFIAFLSGAVISLILIAIRLKRFGNTIPFGPFLVFGFLIVLFWGNFILENYLRMLY